MATFPVTDSSCEEEETSLSPAATMNGEKSKQRKRKSVQKQVHSSNNKRQKNESEEQIYEVEVVVDHKVDREKHLYLVKWKDWSSDSNTWEPVQHLDGCHEALFAFLDDLTSKNEYSEQEYNTLKSELSVFEQADLVCVLDEYVSPKGILIPAPDYDQINEKLKILSRWPESDRDPEVVKIMKDAIKVVKLHEARQAQLDALKEWEEEMNSIILKGNNQSLISVVNNVDLEGPPESFIYINDYLPGEKVNIPEEPPLGCDCEPNCSLFKRKCCPQVAGGVFAYDKDGRVKVPKGTPIYECNKRCKCNSDCINRVVQKGRTVNLSIYRTNSGCGWGVKACETIPKGGFVCEYVGEVITFDEAELRGQKYDKEGQTYLFDLDFNDTNAFPFTVDAATYGNVSHFVNHSCDPNMTVYAVWINCLDPNIPKLALFANREIKQGEEISFDYLNPSKTSNESEQSGENGVVKNRSYNMVCKCKSKKCRKFYL